MEASAPPSYDEPSTRLNDLIHDKKLTIRERFTKIRNIELTRHANEMQAINAMQVKAEKELENKMMIALRECDKQTTTWWPW